MNALERDFKLGRCILRLQSGDPCLIDMFSNVLLPASGNTTVGIGAPDALPAIKICTVNLDVPLHPGAPSIREFAPSEPTAAIALVISLAMDEHLGCLWMDAATLVTPDGKTVLIAGASKAGKTTLSLALALRSRWQVAAEDITLFDTSRGEMIPFITPFSLRADTAGLISETLAQALGNAAETNRDWYFREDLYTQREILPAVLDIAFYLCGSPSAQSSGIELSSVNPGEFLRMTLPLSNVLRLEKGIDHMRDLLARAHCYKLSGGTLKDRMDAILNLCS